MCMYWTNAEVRNVYIGASAEHKFLYPENILNAYLESNSVGMSMRVEALLYLYNVS